MIITLTSNEAIAMRKMMDAFDPAIWNTAMEETKRIDGLMTYEYATDKTDACFKINCDYCAATMEEIASKLQVVAPMVKAVAELFKQGMDSINKIADQSREKIAEHRMAEKSKIERMMAEKKAEAKTRLDELELYEKLDKLEAEHKFDEMEKLIAEFNAAHNVQ